MKSFVTIGRSNECDIIIPDEKVSRMHARISVVGGQYVYEDLGKNGTVIGGRIIHGERVTVAPGADILMAGRIPLPWAQVYSMLPLHGITPYSGSTQVAGGYMPQQTTSEESIGAGWAILSFLIPLVGFIMYFKWKDDTPKRASQACTIAWIGFVLNLIGMFSAM